MKRPAHYEFITPPGGQTCRVRFRGIFNQAPVIWNANIMTLHEAYERMLEQHKLAPGTPLELRQSLLIGEEDENSREIVIALDVPRIDEPTIFKAMVMIHNYKRLRLGRHEYGIPRTFPEP